jgi:hypothetical protein
VKVAARKRRFGNRAKLPGGSASSGFGVRNETVLRGVEVGAGNRRFGVRRCLGWRWFWQLWRAEDRAVFVGVCEVLAALGVLRMVQWQREMNDRLSARGFGLEGGREADPNVSGAEPIPPGFARWGELRSAARPGLPGLDVCVAPTLLLDCCACTGRMSADV